MGMAVVAENAGIDRHGRRAITDRGKSRPAPGSVTAGPAMCAHRESRTRMVRSAKLAGVESAGASSKYTMESIQSLAPVTTIELACATMAQNSRKRLQ